MCWFQLLKWDVIADIVNVCVLDYLLNKENLWQLIDLVANELIKRSNYNESRYSLRDSVTSISVAAPCLKLFKKHFPI